MSPDASVVAGGDRQTVILGNRAVLRQVNRNMRCISARWWPAMALCLVVACTHTEGTTAPGPGSAEPQSDRITQIPLPESGYVYDVAVTEGDVWVTSHAGLFRVDPASVEATNVLPRDDLFGAEPGHGALWISTGSGGRVLRIDPATSSVTAEIDIGAGPVTHLTMSEDAVWVSAISDLVRIDPATNEVVRRLRSNEGSAT
jgi:streptogramin lyase